MTAYLVRLPQAMRFYDKDNGWTFHSATAYQKIFTDYAQAYDYCIDTMPPQINPFERCVSVYTQRDGLEFYNVFAHDFYFLNMGYDHRKPITQLCRRVSECNLTLPENADIYNSDFWQTWWASIAEKWSIVERLHLLRKLGLCCWLDNPFHEDYAYISGDDLVIESWDWELRPRVSKLVDILSASGISNPGIDATTEQWYQWWENNQDWSESQKNFLWWFFCPYFYEIVPVELV